MAIDSREVHRGREVLNGRPGSDIALLIVRLGRRVPLGFHASIGGINERSGALHGAPPPRIMVLVRYAKANPTPGSASPSAPPAPSWP